VDRIIIADAGPLIAFAEADHLAILRQLFGQVWITASAESECQAKPGRDADAIATAIQAGWLVVTTVTGTTSPVPNALGAGEMDSIQLALQSPKSSLLIIDDRLARRRALTYGLNIVGTVRLLDLAEKLGLITSAEQLIQQMREQGYRIAPSLLRQIRGENTAK
jgi:predicted nucleic acid-binding protein